MEKTELRGASGKGKTKPLKNKSRISDRHIDNRSQQGVVSEELWKAAFDLSEDAVSLHSTDGVVLFSNAGMTEVNGRASDAERIWLCSGLFEFCKRTGCDTEGLESGDVDEVRGRLEISGKSFHLLVRSMKDDRGRCVGYLRVLTGLSTDRREKGSIVRVEQLATLGQMVNGIAHDIGTPLNIISGYSEYLLMRLKSEDQGHNEISTILQQARRIAVYIKLMLDMARASQGRKEHISLGKFLGEIVDLTSYHFRKADVRVSVSGDESVATVYGDGLRLKQAFFCLMMNAMEKVGSGGSIEIALANEQEAGFVNITFMGVEADGKPHDFTISLKGMIRANKDKTRRNHECVIDGLGLSLAQDVFQEMGAIISAGESWAKKAFVVKLPVGWRSGE